MDKKKIPFIIGIIVFILMAVGVSYSFFVYNKEIAEVSLDMGDISIDLANINGSINLSSISNDLADYSLSSWKLDSNRIPALNN